MVCEAAAARRAGSPSDPNADARTQAELLWNTTPCGRVGGDPSSLEYFLAVERSRYEQQPWMAPYFSFQGHARMKVLEVGVGHGTDLVQFAQGGAYCHGIDVTDAHLTLAKQNFVLRDLSAVFKKSDATAIDYPDGFFDVVYSFGVLHHIPQPEMAIREIQRVLKPRGTLYLGVYHRYSAFHVFTKLLCHGLRFGQLFSLGYHGLLSTIEDGADGTNVRPYVRLYSKRSLRKLLDGFQVVDVSVRQLSPSHFWPSVLGRMLTRHVGRLERHLGWYVVCRAVKSASLPP